MQKINLWKMIGLYVVTLGIYGFVWLARCRNEIVKKYKLAIPHWLWMVVPSVIALAIFLPIVFIGFAVFDIVTLTYLAAGVLLLEFIVVYGISIWWMWKFGQAAEKITQGRMPLGWTVGWWIFWGPVVFFILQHFLNHVPAKVDTKAAPKHKPTKRFVVISLLFFALSIVATAIESVVFLSTESDDWTTFTQEARDIDQKGKKADRLLEQYNTCINRLDEKYPGELMIEDEAEYNKGYNACESIRMKQNTAADEYNEAFENW